MLSAHIHVVEARRQKNASANGLEVDRLHPGFVRGSNSTPSIRVHKVYPVNTPPSNVLVEENIPLERKDRFPSAEERVKVYMTNWFLPPCSDQDKATYAINATHLTVTAPRGGVTVHYPMMYRNDDIGAFTKQKQLEKCAQGPCRTKERIARALCAYCIDIPFDVEEKPFLFSFGDAFASGSPQRKDAETIVPHFRKVRYGTTKESLRKVTTSPKQCLTWEERTPLNLIGRSAPSTIMSPIVWLLKYGRHFGMLPAVSKNDVPWEDKKDGAVYRGSLTGLFNDGFASDMNTTLSDYEKCMMIHKCRLVYNSHALSNVDAKIVYTKQYQFIPQTLHNITLTGEPMSLKDQLQFKCIIMLEGNDVSSGLKWALYSNSVVLMPPPTRMSWAMEDQLEPYVHYIPLRPALDDIGTQLQWVQDHEKEAQRIAQRGQLWIYDLLGHPDAEKDHAFIQNEVERRYLSFFQPRNDTIIRI